MRLPILAATTLAVTAVITLAPTATRAETITGTFRYHDGDGDLPPIADAVVEVWRFRPRALGVWSWGNDLTARTDLNGQLSATVPFVGAGVITTVRVFATNSHARVMTQDLPLTAFYQTPGSPTELQRTTVSAGDVLDFSFNFGSSFAQIHYNAAEAVRRGGSYVAARRDPAETDVLWPMVVQIYTAGLEGYDQASDLIRLRPLTAMDDLSVLTMYANHVMANIGSHGVVLAGATACGGSTDLGQVWRLGFPLYYAHAVALANPGVIDGPATFGLTAAAIESPACPAPAAPFAFQAPRLAGALFDLIDGGSEAFDPLCTAGTSHDTTILRIVDRELDLGFTNPTLQQFAEAWMARGLDLPPLELVFANNDQDVVAPPPLVATDVFPAANLVTYRDGTWRLRGAAVSTRSFGTAAERPVPADYDGDGLTDLSVWHPVTAQWRTLLSATGRERTVNWGFGTAGEVPLPADYDGDGEADLGVFWPALGRVYVQEDACGATRTIVTGGGAPVVGDFDGDGRDEPALYQSATGQFRVTPAVGAPFTLTVATTGGTPLAADFDGDGRDDPAVFQPTTGNWHVRRSMSGTTTVTFWGAPDETPAPADVDGDGRADFVTYVAASALWFVLEADGPAFTVPFGDLGARPVPAR